MKNLIIASDHAGFDLKDKLYTYLKSDYNIEDAGTHNEESVDYPDFGLPAAEKVGNGIVDAGILICGSGIGMSIVANKVKNVRGALCSSEKIARLSRQHNNANILVLPGRFIDFKQAKKVVDVWLKTSFNAGRHKRRIDKISLYEEDQK